MQASRANGYVYYRCRFAAEYAIVNKISHPRDILIREAELVPALDEWLASQFEPDRVEATIDVLTLAQEDPGAEQQTILQARQIICDCEAKTALPGRDRRRRGHPGDQPVDQRHQGRAPGRRGDAALPVTARAG